LDKNTQLKTDRLSECSITFDAELKNILTIKENSQFRLESTKPAQAFLAQGRVFALIENVTQIEKFELRTPIAIAGVRGRGMESIYGWHRASTKRD
jgi:hypothetical protein